MLAAGACSVVNARPANRIERWRSLIDRASTRCGVPANWIAKVMRAESGGRTERDGRPITSSAGAMGLMQLMPATWAYMRSRLALAGDPHDPRDNILAGSCYLRLMYERFGYPGLFAAYNFGPARYAEHLATGRALPEETRSYLATMTGSDDEGVLHARRPQANGIFFDLDAGARRRNSVGGSQSPLFVRLDAVSLKRTDHAEARRQEGDTPKHD